VLANKMLDGNYLGVGAQQQLLVDRHSPIVLNLHNYDHPTVQHCEQCLVDHVDFQDG
jgi:hypothetical protein